mmetsp:Transcript_76308/g.220459  ORF Transcript_76308/g.220459 Transcript_76308/m.220459 type:complete len:392 (-) Transcript_76308:74-1249(-)
MVRKARRATVEGSRIALGATVALGILGLSYQFASISEILPGDVGAIWHPSTQTTTSTTVTSTTVTSTATSTTAQRGSPEQIRPMIWLHFPKCGSSFEVLLVHHACGDKIPENYTLLDPLDKMPKRPKKVRCRYNGKKVKFGWANASTCRWNALCGDVFSRFSGGHDPLWLHPLVDAKWSYPIKSSELNEVWSHPTVGKAFGVIEHVAEADLSKVIAIFREPRQRAISHWYHLKSKGLEYDFKEIAKQFSACMTQMIVGATCGRKAEDGSPFLFDMTDIQLKEVLQARIPRFGFVGITEEWELSVCLFHTMYGGDCLPSEFLQLRKGISRNAKSYNTSMYNIDTYDSIDLEAYDVARGTFQDLLHRYGVGPRRCATEICPRAAAHFEALQQS